MARLTQADLVDLNKSFEERTPQELIGWANEVFGKRVAAISAMQSSGAVICHMISSMKMDMRIFFVDTGVMFPETLETRDRIEQEYGLDIVTLKPEQSMEEQSRELGVLYLTPEGQEKCCHLRKVEPLKAVADQYDAFIGSLRRSDGGRRSLCPFLAVDMEMNSLRINPLVNFTDEQLVQYIDEHDVITNPLHAQGYPSISCSRCTTPVLPNEPKRAGRWRHLGPWSVYCGINPTDVDRETSPGIDLPQNLIDRILGRETDFVI